MSCLTHLQGILARPRNVKKAPTAKERATERDLRSMELCYDRRRRYQNYGFPSTVGPSGDGKATSVNLHRELSSNLWSERCHRKLLQLRCRKKLNTSLIGLLGTVGLTTGVTSHDGMRLHWRTIRWSQRTTPPNTLWRSIGNAFDISKKRPEPLCLQHGGATNLRTVRCVRPT